MDIKKVAVRTDGTPAAPAGAAATLHIIIRRMDGGADPIKGIEINEALDGLKKQLDAGATAGRIRLDSLRSDWRLDGSLED